MFDVFAQMLENDESIQFTVTRKGDRLSVLVQPVLRGGMNDKASEAVQNLRAALAMPLYVTTTPDALDRDFPHSLAEFAGMREQVKSDLTTAIGRIKEAGKQARAESAASTDNSEDQKTVTTDGEEQPENKDVSGDCDKSLF
jgi:PRTRC genetic system protein E